MKSTLISIVVFGLNIQVIAGLRYYLSEGFTEEERLGALAELDEYFKENLGIIFKAKEQENTNGE